jgi:hypothetical protein
MVKVFLTTVSIFNSAAKASRENAIRPFSRGELDH